VRANAFVGVVHRHVGGAIRVFDPPLRVGAHELRREEIIEIGRVMDIGHAGRGKDLLSPLAYLVRNDVKDVCSRVAESIEDLLVVELRLGGCDVQRCKITLTDFRFVMGLVGSRRAEREDVDLRVLEEEVHPVANGLLCSIRRTAVNHLDAVIIADEDGVFH
jgi:hypothetical protein